MTTLQTISFRCRIELFRKLEHFAVTRHIDRTSVLKLAVHQYLNKQTMLSHASAAPVAAT